MRIPGPGHQEDGGLSAVATAGGLHRYQLRLHDPHGPVVRFQLPGAGPAVSTADPVLLEAAAHLDERPAELFAFLDGAVRGGQPASAPGRRTHAMAPAAALGAHRTPVPRTALRWRWTSRTAGAGTPTGNRSRCSRS